VDLARYQGEQDRFVHLSLHDLLEARDLYHPYLMQHPNVVATAIGRYRIRVDDSWPGGPGPARHGHTTRTLANSEVRPYSWPAILVFVERWATPAQFSGQSASGYQSTDRVPPSLFLPDGREVPVCVIEAPKVAAKPPSPTPRPQPLNNLGGSSPIFVDVQGQTHFATVGCLVSDGHTAYALTNRHVAGRAGEVLSSELDGRVAPVGRTASAQLSRVLFTDLYPGWPGRDTYVNLDIGMIEVDDVDRWTARIGDFGQVGQMADLSTANIGLGLIGCHVVGQGAGGGSMAAEVAGLFYRYKAQGGFEYVADLFLGPRPIPPARSTGTPPPSLVTRPGDSGTLWLLEPKDGPIADDQRLPLALQWGEQRFTEPGVDPQPYVLATLLSSVCRLLEVDVVRDWNLDQPDTWGSVGHYSIGAHGADGISARVPKLRTLMHDNLAVISYDDATLGTSSFAGMTTAAEVPLADVPDYCWKLGKQGFKRGAEGPNHFADMDQPGPDGKTLLDLCKQIGNVDPLVWDTFYGTVKDLLSGDPISQQHRGLIPFRVWQIYDAMVGFAGAGDAKRFVCAAGVLAHYVGDACQPLHVSYLHDGDPLRPQQVQHTSHGQPVVKTEAYGAGVHSAYEDDMVGLPTSRAAILAALAKTPKVAKAELLADGKAAAVATVKLMRTTIGRLPPMDIVEAYVAHTSADGPMPDYLWKQFGAATIKAMVDGTHLLAVVWESAWVAGNGEANVAPTTFTVADAMKVCQQKTFVPSTTIAKIGAILK